MKHGVPRNEEAAAVVHAVNVRRRLGEWLLTLPSLGMLILLVGIPMIVILLTAFRQRTGDGWSLDAIRNISAAWETLHWPIIKRTLFYSSITTVLTILIGMPVAYLIARANTKIRGFLILLIMIPFWTNMLVHVSAWRVVLHPDGVLRQTLLWLGIIGEADYLLNNAGAVILLMVYVFLPFAILPLYAAIEKFDFTLLESARDLGASRMQSLVRVFLPGISGGIVAAAMLVFVPVMGCYIIPDLVGNYSTTIISNIIIQRALTDRNMPEAAALSGLLLLGMILAWAVFRVLRVMKNRKEGGGA